MLPSPETLSKVILAFQGLKREIRMMQGAERTSFIWYAFLVVCSSFHESKSWLAGGTPRRE